MTKIIWNERTLRWFQAAAEYTEYHKEMAKLILCYTKKRGTLCDIGCGAGLTDFELAPYFGQIFCVDIANEVVDFINEKAKKLGMNHVSAICKAGEELAGDWDIVTTMFHGGSDIFSKYFKYAKDRLIIIIHDEKSERFDQKENHCNRFYNVRETKESLDGLGVCYELIQTEFEYGQPFKDVEDAIAFFDAYVKFDNEAERNAYLKEHLIETGDEKYPYYQPKKRKFGMFVIRRDQNEKFVQKALL